MANTRLSDLDNGGVFASTDLLYAVEAQGVGGVNKTGAQLAEFIRDTVAGFISGSTNVTISHVDSSSPSGDSLTIFFTGTQGEALTADRTYYVSTSGSDTNTGLSSATPFATIQKAIDEISQLIIGPYDVTIDVADGTYTDSIVVSGPWLGSGSVLIDGNTTTPGNVIINPSSGSCLEVKQAGVINIRGVKFQSSVSSDLVTAFDKGIINITGSFEFGAQSPNNRSHMSARTHGIINIGENYTISGGARWHINAAIGGLIRHTKSLTVTINGAFSFDREFCRAISGSLCRISGATYTFTPGSSVNGRRYSVNALSIIETNGGGSNYFPGSADGISNANFGGYYT